jgi:thiol-disulfide isomerase/thioredoxin
MKTLLLILFPLLLILFACENEEAVEPLEINFHVSGKVSNAIGQTISIIKPSKNGNELIASARIKSDGSFAIDGNIPELEKYIMKIGNEEKNSVPLALNIKDHLKINTSLETFSYSLNASGTEWSSTMNEYLTLRHEFELKMDAIAKEQESLSEEEFTIKLIDSKQKIEEFSRDKIKSTPESPYNIILSMELIPVNGFENWNLENLKCLEIMVTGYQNKYGDTPISRSVASQYEQFSAGYEQYKAIENGTMAAPDFTLSTPEGKPISLSSLKGKVVLIDFWASWCGPCRKENPNLVKLYEKYKDKGFTILSVSLDNNEAAWKGAIEADGLIWPNHVSDLKGWESTMTKVYGFNSIPHTVLVNKEGKINGIGLRGEALEEKIKSILKI